VYDEYVKLVLFIILILVVSGLAYCDETIESVYLSEELIISLGIFNDNLLCTYDAALEGWAWGPDDIFTFGGVVKGIYRWCIFGIDYSSITSRNFLYRFDFLKISALYSIPLPGTGFFTAGGGCFYTGRVLGEDIQNGFHDIIGYPQVYLPYLDGTFSGFISAGVTLDFFRLDEWGVLSQLYAESEIYAPSGLNHGKTGVSLKYSSRFFDLEAAGGILLYFSLPGYFDMLLRSGLFGSILLTFKIPSIISLSAGVGGFPVQNALDDPLFVNRDYPYMPQIRILLSYGKGTIPIRELFIP
jgi:hypothetical protein